MPDLQTPEQQTAPAVVESTPTGTQQEQDRAAIYSKLYATPEPAVQEAVTEPEVPVAETPSTPVVETPDYNTLFANQQAIIENLQAQITQLQPKPTPAPAVDPTASKAVMEEWVGFMAAGDYVKAEEFLLEKLGPKLQQRMQPQIVQQSVEATNAERDITNFVSSFEETNADLMPFKDYVVLGAERRLNIAQNEGKIKSTADFVREYKLAVTEEANTLRKQFQLSRAAGKQEALTTHREVLSATTLEPNGITQQPAQPKSGAVASSPLDYIAQRRERMAGYQGMRSN